MRKHLERILEQHEVLLNGIPRVPDVQSAWLLLLQCASARANYQLRVMRPECVLEFARAHDENMWRGLCTILEVPTTACSRNARDLSSLPLSLGGFGFEKRHKNTSVSLLGKLGGHIAHGAEPTSSNCRHHGVSP